MPPRQTVNQKKRRERTKRERAEKKKEKRNTSKSRNMIICQERPRGVHIFFICYQNREKIRKRMEKKERKRTLE